MSRCKISLNQTNESPVTVALVHFYMYQSLWLTRGLWLFIIQAPLALVIVAFWLEKIILIE